MFKKPLSDLKTSAPIRSSDRRKLRQRVIDAYQLSLEIGDTLVPDGLHSQKFSSHVNTPGILYLSQEGDPLWFTLGKGSDELIPTVYTLWKQPTLLPFLATPAAVIPKLIGGADLMIPGVIQHTSELSPHQLVSITQYHSAKPPSADTPSATSIPQVGPPLAVGRMALSGEEFRRKARMDDDEARKGKAVILLHSWKDFLWDMGIGKKADVPMPRAVMVTQESVVESEDEDEESDAEDSTEGHEDGHVEEASPRSEEIVESQEDAAPSLSSPSEEISPGPEPSLTPAEVSDHLRDALLQALSTTLKSSQPSAFPIQASIFWAAHILPARSAYVDASALDIKHSTHKSVKVFLKACAKEGLIKLKESKGDVMVTGVFPQHPAVMSHRSHKTIGSVEAKREKAEERERQEKEEEEKRKSEIQVTELWQPFGTTIGLFVTAGKSSEELYTFAEIRDTFSAYVAEKNLVNANEQQYINVGDDDALSSAASVKNKERPEFLKRDETLKRIQDNMQSWYRVAIEGEDTITKKGALKPISVEVKTRTGRKLATFVTGFEPFYLTADGLADDLRKICASSTSVAPVGGKASSDMVVMVQGKQIKGVVGYLMSKGVPQQWIHADLKVEKKKKK